MRKTTAIWAGLWVGLTAGPLVGSADERAAWDARIVAVEGEVYLFPDKEEDGVPAEKDTPLSEGDRVATGAGGRAEIALDDSSILELSENSSFVVESLKEEESLFELVLGRLAAKLRSLAGENKLLKVKTPTAVAAVRGTEFGVEVAEDGVTVVGVYDEGQVGVSAATDDSVEETLVRAREQTEVGFGEGLDAEERDGARRLKIERLRDAGRFKDRFKHLRARRGELRKTWRAMGPERRQALRRGLIERRGKLSGQELGRIREFASGRNRRILKGRQGLEELRERLRQGGGPGRGGPRKGGNLVPERGGKGERGRGGSDIKPGRKGQRQGGGKPGGGPGRRRGGGGRRK